ncbi:MAG: acyl-CoA dehydrogenase family protein, partial [Micromonosporaceae bacterium]
PQHVWAERDPATLRSHGSLCLGVTARCCTLLGAGVWNGQLDACREALDSAGPEELPAARAAAAELALRAAAMLTVTMGSRSVLLDEHGQRLLREATFLLVFGSRPGIKAALLDRLGHNGR